ncbi:MAG: hypothetical protein PVI97_03070 [Candidatus Thiodiazotropha sp.]|jgi:hypothetical protein
MNEQRKQAWTLWIALVLCGFVVIDLYIKLALPIISNDLWWHMVLGRQVLDTGSLIPDHSIFSWTPATSYHAYNSWLSDIILYLIHEATGISGLLLLRYCVFFSMLLLAVCFVRRTGVFNHPLSWAIILIGFTLCWPSFLVKPELFSLGLFTLVVWLYYHIRATGETAWRLVYLFPVILIVWVNIHGAFFLSALFFASAIIGELLNLRFNPDQAMTGHLRKHFFIAMLLCFPSILVNPYGFELPLGIIESLVTQSAQDYGNVGAYNPTYVLNKAPYYLLDYLILAMFVFVVLLWQKMKLRQTDWVVILSFVIFSALFIQMIRTTYFLAPVFIFSSLDLLRSKTKSSLWPGKLMLKNIITIFSTFIVGAISFRVINFGGVSITDHVNWLEKAQYVGYRFPQAEADYIASSLKGHKIGNFYGDGGYLIYRLWPEKQVMIDPRYFPFKEWIDGYIRFSSEGEDIQEFVESMPADFWLIGYDRTPVFYWFSHSKQWSLAFFGPVGAIFVPSNDFNGVIRYSWQINGFSSIGEISKALGAAIILRNIPLAKELRAIADRNIDSDFRYKDTFIDEIDNLLQGMEALENQDLNRAADLFAKGESNRHALSLSAKLYRYLASLAWRDKDYLKARVLSIAAYDVLPTKTFPDMYNISLTDWHVQHGEQSDLKEVKNDVLWEKYVNAIIDNQEMISKEQKFIIDTAIAMKKGYYNGKADLFQQKEFYKNEAELLKD